jgi:signal transduction histidine kinase
MRKKRINTSKKRKKFGLGPKLFLAILAVAIVCVVTSAVLALVLASREVQHRLEYSTPPGEPPPPAPPPVKGVPPWLWICFLVAGIAGLVLAMGLSLFMANRISKPLGALTAATSSIADGEYGNTVDVAGGREIEELAIAFNKLSEKLAKNELLRQNMVADIAHELRTPLTTLRGDFEALQDGLLEPGSKVLENLMGDVLMLSRLIEDLQQLTLADAGQLTLQCESIDPKAFVDDVASRFENELARKGVSLDVRLEDDLERIDADRFRLTQVLSNLVKNSLQHTPAGGAITVSVTPTESGLIFAVSDNGPGIDREDLPFIFERFYRTDKSRTRSTGGTGLGLAIARTLVNAGGGHIWAESEAGEGTTISFTVPTSVP